MTKKLVNLKKKESSLREELNFMVPKADDKHEYWGQEAYFRPYKDLGS